MGVKQGHGDGSAGAFHAKRGAAIFPRCDSEISRSRRLRGIPWSSASGSTGHWGGHAEAGEASGGAPQSLNRPGDVGSVILRQRLRMTRLIQLSICKWKQTLRLGCPAAGDLDGRSVESSSAFL